MTFVPVVSTPPAPSPRARKLGARLTETIDRFRQEDPTLSPAEIRQAIHLAKQGAGTGGSNIAIALAVMFLVLGLAVFFYFGRGVDFAEQPLFLILTIGVTIVAIGIAKMVKNR